MMGTSTQTSTEPLKPVRQSRPPKSKGFEFIITSSDLLAKNSEATTDLRKEQKRQVKSHVSRGRVRQAKGGRHLPSWVNKDTPNHHGTAQSTAYAPAGMSNWLGASMADAAFFSNPNRVERAVVHQCIHFLRSAVESMYPATICEHPGDEDSSMWTHYLLSDNVYLHAMKFSAAAQADAIAGRDMSLATLQKASRTFQLLQKRLDSERQDVVISDPTIMAILLLAWAAGQLGDVEGAGSHVGGLQKIIALRGGFAGLPTTTDQLWTKVCRVDLGLALKRGTTPVFFKDNISWDVYITEATQSLRVSNALPPALFSHDASGDSKLSNIWVDLRRLSSMANLGQQTGRKIPTDTFSEITTSILYRLLHLAPRQNILQEGLRLGMLAYAAAVSFQWHQPSQYEEKQEVVGQYAGAMLAIRTSQTEVSDQLALWLLVNLAIVSFPKEVSFQEEPDDINSWMLGLFARLNISSWAEIKSLLKSFLWVDILHDQVGKMVYGKLAGGIHRPGCGS